MSELTTESVIINRLGKGENKVNFILIPPPPPLLTPSRPLSNIDLQRSLFVSLKGNFSHICFHCAPFFERSSFFPYYLLLYSSNYYIDKYRCYCDLCFSHFKEMLDSPACRYNTCSIVVNITPTDSGSHDINWPEDSYFSSFIPRTCITGSVPPVKLVTYHVNVTNYNDQLHFFDG